ncbi:hypothetical protein D3C84_1302750 [compost metagenome]
MKVGANLTRPIYYSTILAKTNDVAKAGGVDVLLDGSADDGGGAAREDRSPP